ncbi:TELO2-interacting protein 2 [Solea solea]|uniref:TELO2-interacting protein 2 n=1 Tax=Solea solea TaxID=90069 RepID=UPI00272DB9C4|nr:TELO2-interacting protein 2 [Solea solea]
MELSSLLDELHLSSSQKPLPSPPFPSITELLSRLQDKLLGASSDSETSSLFGRVEQLFKTADPDWLFSPVLANDDVGQVELQRAYRSLVSTMMCCAALPLCEDDCGSLTAAAYQNVPSRAILVCSVLRSLVGALGHWERAGLLLTVAPPLCVFAVTHFQDQAWTTPSSRVAAQRLHKALLRAGGWRDSVHLLMGDTSQQEEGGKNRGILEGVLDVLQPHLTKDLWQRSEAVKLVFGWILLQVPRPFLSPYLPRLLPPPLLFNDHYRPENCMLGVRCLHHIIVNTSASELRQFNRAEVVYQALFKHLYTSEASVIELVLSCLLDLLLVFEKPPSSVASSCRKPSRHDDVLRLFLTHMEAENKVPLRRIYASILPLYIDRMGVAVCRHLRRLERVVLGYLEIRDPPEEINRLKTLEVLQKTTRAAWPRMEARINVLLRCLLRLLVDVSSDSELKDSVTQELMSQTVLCIKLLDDCSLGKLQPLLQQVNSSCCSPAVFSCLATITTPTER